MTKDEDGPTEDTKHTENGGNAIRRHPSDKRASEQPGKPQPGRERNRGRLYPDFETEAEADEPRTTNQGRRTKNDEPRTSNQEPRTLPLKAFLLRG